MNNTMHIQNKTKIFIKQYLFFYQNEEETQKCCMKKKIFFFWFPMRFYKVKRN